MMILLLLSLQLNPETLVEFLHFFEENQSFSADFEQLTESSFFEPTLSSGVLYISQPGKFRMSYLKGEERNIICDGTTYFEEDLLAETRTTLPFKDIKEEPLIRILIFGEDLNKHFLIDRYASKSSDVFRLRPRNGDGYRIEMTFSPQWQPLTLAYISDEGESTTLVLTQFKKNPEFPVDLFSIPR